MILEMKTPGDVFDLIGYMILSGPEMKSKHFPMQNIDSTFHELQHGLDNIKNKLGEAGYKRLKDAASEAQALYLAGDHQGGNLLLQHMSEYMRLRKYKTDENVVDESRFEP